MTSDVNAAGPVDRRVRVEPDVGQARRVIDLIAEMLKVRLGQN